MTNIYWSICFVISVMGLLPNSVHLENFTVGYLPHIQGGNDVIGQGLLVSGALNYAIDLINNNKTLLGDHYLSIIFNETKGHILNNIKLMIDQWTAGAIVVFGPEHTCETEATVAASLNLAMMSYRCADAKPSKKTIFKTFARTNPSNTKIINSVIALLHHFQWSKFSIIYQDSLKYQTAIDSMVSKSKKNNFTIMNKETYDRYSAVGKQILRIVERTYLTTRIYVMFGGREAVVELMITLMEKELLSSGEYLVVYVDLEEYDPEHSYEYFWRPEDLHMGEIRTPIHVQRSLLVVVQTPGRVKEEYKQFTKNVIEYNAKPPFNFEKEPHGFDLHVPLSAAHLFDAVMVYAEALNEVLKTNGDPRNGTLIIQHIIARRKYRSVSGSEVRIDENGEVDGNFSLLALQPRPPNITLKAPYNGSTHIIYPVGVFQLDEVSQELKLNLYGKINWVGGQKPYCEPLCGFNGTECNEAHDNRHILAGLLGAILFSVSVTAAIIYRNWKYEQEIAGLLWRVRFSELEQVGKGRMTQCPSKISMMSEISVESKAINQIFTQVAMYRGTVVAIKQLRYSRRITDIPRKTKKEMKLMRELRHDNVNSFIGACVEPTSIYLLSEYCSKGSLQDILENDDMRLDNMFIASLVFDLIKGLMFIHESDMKVHGNLKSSNCVVTSRWVLQVADFGLHSLRVNAESGSIAEHQYYRNLLWKAPELLRDSSNASGTQKADIYAFGIILHEIICRQGPFGGVDLSPKDIIERVKNGCRYDGVPFRPCTRDLECQDYIVQTMEEAWNEYPEMRPEIRRIKGRLRKMAEGMKSNIMDNMMELMEKYANNLEELVDERTALLVEEKKKTVALLHRMLPTSVAAQLIRGEPVIPESFDAVTIYFSDIVGFTEMSANSTPMEVVDFLNDLYTLFDAVIAHFDVYKVETIGDAYMVVSGLPIRNGDKHASEISSMALKLLAAIKTFKIRHRPNQILKLRIGIHTGPVVAGVVGLTMPRYCLFGDTVNTASRMESNGEPLKIHISPFCKNYLEKLGGYEIESRGLVKMKGKGEMETFWLLGHTEDSKFLQDLKISLPQPLFAVPQEKKSPKSTKTECRRGSLIPQSDNTNISSLEDQNIVRNGSAHGFQAYLRLSQNSPRLCRRYSPHSLRDTKLLRHCERDIKNEETSSCGDVRNHSNEHRYTKPARSALVKKGEEVTNPTTSPLTCYNCNPIPEPGRNGIVSIDDTLKPLLDMKKQASPRRANSRRYLKSRLLELPSKAWRSCDDFVFSQSGSRSSLKDLLSRRINRKMERIKNSKDNSSLSIELCQEENAV